ncbi:unnamed protein product [Calypogeia fissa]
MATLGLECMHQQLLQPRGRTMSRMTAGLLCDRLQQRVCCSSIHQMHTASYGVNLMIAQTRRLEIMAMASKRATSGRNLVLASSSGRCLVGDGDAAGTREEENFVSMANSAECDDRADILGWKEEDEHGVEDDAAVNRWRYEFENLIRGHVGKFAFLAILLMGVGVGCLTNVGDAEAATNHINSNGSLDVDMRAIAMGPEGPLLEEFWDNMRRYGLYFVTVVTGGVYQLVKPIIDALRNPLTTVLVIIIVSGSLYLVGLTVSAMLGVNEYYYQYAQ